MQKFVNVHTVNLSLTPNGAADQVIAELHVGQKVEDLEDGLDGWFHVRTTVTGNVVEGFMPTTIPEDRVKWPLPDQSTLRAETTPAREALVAAAVEQWHRFKLGEGKETEDKYSGYIHEMWQAFGFEHTGKTDIAWSAVAISLMVRNAAKSFAGYRDFKESWRHSKYMFDAIKKGASGDLGAPFWGVRLDKATPQPGDIIGNWRNKPYSFDRFLAHSDYPRTETHTDIVVAVGPRVAWTIGGNVSHSVYLTGYELSEDGHLLVNQRKDKAKKLVGEAIVLMDNRVTA